MLSREDIKTIYDQGPDAVIALVEGMVATFQQQIEQLQAQVKELQDRLALNSGNSSKPPSSNPPAQRTKSLRTASGKKSGAQPGHPGTTLKASPTPDHVLVHDPAACQGCGQSLQGLLGQPTNERRQVFDLPALKLEVTEHQISEKVCQFCDRRTCGEFPAAVGPGVQYGSNLKALAVYLVNYHLLPWQRSCEIIGALFGQSIAEGTIWSALNQCSDALEKPEAEIKQALAQAAVVNFDETGLYVGARRQWLHVASTRLLTHYGPHAKRGAAATNEIGILPEFGGRAIHDAWAPYFSYDCAHGLCNAHHLRELTFVQEQLGQAWATEMKDLLVEIKGAVEQARARGEIELESALQGRCEQRYDQLVAVGLELPANHPPAATGKRGRVKQSKAKNLLDRLSQHKVIIYLTHLKMARPSV